MSIFPQSINDHWLYLYACFTILCSLVHAMTYGGTEMTQGEMFIEIITQSLRYINYTHTLEEFEVVKISSNVPRETRFTIKDTCYA